MTDAKLFTLQMLQKEKDALFPISINNSTDSKDAAKRIKVINEQMVSLVLEKPCLSLWKSLVSSLYSSLYSIPFPNKTPIANEKLLHEERSCCKKLN